MHKAPTLSDNETIVEYFSSHAVRALKEKKKMRRRFVLVLLVLPKLLTVAYFGLQAAAPFVP